MKEVEDLCEARILGEGLDEVGTVDGFYGRGAGDADIVQADSESWCE